MKNKLAALALAAHAAGRNMRTSNKQIQISIVKRRAFSFVAGSLLCVALTASATTRFVDSNNLVPVAPYTNWVTAATNIQMAVDAALAGDDVLVTNGTYQTGTTLVGMLNRVAVNKAVTVRSVNGPDVTVIVGAGPNGTSAVRCVYLTNGAMLSGFTLTNGATQTSGNVNGGGVFCGSVSAVLSNCVLVGNTAGAGAAAFGGTLFNCQLKNNSANTGGGAHSSSLINCTLSGNWASGEGGGATACSLTNCTVLSNASGASGAGVANCALTGCLVSSNSSYYYAGGAISSTLYNCALIGNWCNNNGGGAEESTLYNCLLIGNRAEGWGGGIAFADAYNCTMVGNSTAHQGGGSYSGSTFNCIIYYNTATTGSPNCYSSGSAYTRYCCIAQSVSGSGNITADPKFANTNAWSNLRLLAGSPCINTGYNGYTTNQPDLDGNARISGSTVDIGAYESQPLHYVSLTSTNPQIPFATWSTAATNIQAAVDAAVAGDSIVVTNGMYQSGATAKYGMSNRVAVTKAVTVRSVNGATVTSIMGSGPNGPAAVRCAYLTNGAVLAGFTLTNGAVQTSGDNATNLSGGGVWCASSNSVVSNCVFVGNSAYFYGGGAYSGTLKNCELTDNSAAFGGGASSATLYNCTLAGNSAFSGGGSYGGILNNCIVYYNTATSAENYSGGTFQYCCTTPLASGAGNLSNAPLFMDTNAWNNLRLQPGSPCRNVGNNAYAASSFDLDGNPRIIGSAVDLGAFEVQPLQLIVTTSNDSGAGSLRATIDLCSPGDTVIFAPALSDTTILLTSGQIGINKNITVDASVLPGGIAINGNHASRIFQIGIGVPVVLNSLTISNGIDTGDGNEGGGGILNYGNLTLNNCTVAGNFAQSTWGGGGILGYNYSLTLNQCTLAGNSAAYFGGGIIAHGTTVTLNQCTLSGNSAGQEGGGIYNGGSATINNSIVAGNIAPSAADIYGSVSQVGNNLISGAPLLAPLGNYGGSTPTMPPLCSSPALDAGSDAITNSFPTDQRGFGRRSGTHVDIGAVEAQVALGNPPQLCEATTLGGGSFQFAFTNNTPGATFTVFTTTNLTLPFRNWTMLGVPLQSPPGQFRFCDEQATNCPQRFYRVTSP